MAIETPTEILRTQLATQNAASPVGQEVIAGQNRATGEAVSVSSNNADLTDALEELGMAASHRAKVDLAKVKVKKGAGTDLEALARIAEYIDKLPNMPNDERMRELARRFAQHEELARQSGGSQLPTKEDLYQLLNDFDGDITHQFAALEMMRAEAGRTGAPEGYLAVLDQMRAELREGDKAQEILAGFRAAPVAYQLARQTGDDPAQIREGYREMLRSTPSFGQIFDNLRKFSLSESFDAIVSSFQEIAGRDLSSFGPSVEPSRLGQVLDELGKLKQVKSVFEGAKQALGKLERLFPSGGEEGRPNALDITGRLLTFVSSPVASQASAESLLAGFPPDNPELQVAVINLVRDLHASIPDAVVHSPSAREMQSKVLLDISDRLVAAEEAAWGG